MSKKQLTKLTTDLRQRGRSFFTIFITCQGSAAPARRRLRLSHVLPVAGALLLWVAQHQMGWSPFALLEGSKAITTISDCAPLGGHKPVSLPDGSTVELNTGTCVSGTFSPKQRLLRLDSGEGIFQVVHDPNRPFIVDTGRVSIADVGTRFDVYSREDTGMRIAVIEGAIQIYPRGPTSHHNGTPLTAGQEIDIPIESTQISLVKRITAQDFQRMTAWLDGVIQFDGQPLAAILAEFERYQHISFKATDPKILTLPIGGAFHTTDVDSFLRALKVQCIRGKYDDAHQNITLTRITRCH